MISALLIDDDPNMHVLLMEYFSQIRFTCVASMDAYRALLNHKPFFHFIVLDVKLGQDNGLDLIKKLKINHPATPIIVLTGFTSVNYMQQAISEKVEAYLEKPLDFKLLDKHLLRLNCLMDNNYEQAVEDIVLLLDDVDQQDFHVKDYAAQYYLNYKYLCKIFKDLKGESLRDFLKNKKYTHACSLLDNRSLSVTQVSNKLGFMNPSAFMRGFKDFKGCTPSEYRKNLI
eukprot:COSAG01_NODE_69_length_28801_cov_10.460038_7_plen_229_part_00